MNSSRAATDFRSTTALNYLACIDACKVVTCGSVTSSVGNAAAEMAYSYTKTQIINGKLRGGELLSEGRIGAELNISRTPVHEAFLRLGTEQFLDLVSRKGAIVRPMSPAEAANVLAMRQGIEAASAGQVFAAGGPNEHVALQLEENLNYQDECVASGNVTGFIDADDAFHATMVEASENPVAQHFYDQLRSRQQRLRNVLLRIDPANLASSYSDHRNLAFSFIDGNQEQFNARLVAHLNRYQGAL